MTTTVAASAPIHPLASALVDIGALWATHGLRVARSALATSARTLHTAATAIDALAGDTDLASDVPAAIDVDATNAP